MMRRFAFLVAFSLVACAERHTDKYPDDDSFVDVPINQLAGLPGTACNGDPTMVVVTSSTLGDFCIDRLEATLDGGALGNLHQGTDDLDTSVDGSTQAAAQIQLGVAPAFGLSWYQAKSACLNAGKRLCTQGEWELGCRGPDGWDYPYGETTNDNYCNGFFKFSETNPRPTGSLSSCGSVWGAYDMSGNVEEWTETPAPRDPGAPGVLNDRAVRGGSYVSNENALSCVGPEFHAAPGSTSATRGFRCCKTL